MSQMPGRERHEGAHALLRCAAPSGAPYRRQWSLLRRDRSPTVCDVAFARCAAHAAGATVTHSLSATTTRSGFPALDERGLFEKLALETFGSGVSWRTILAKRDAFRARVPTRRGGELRRRGCRAPARRPGHRP